MKRLAATLVALSIAVAGCSSSPDEEPGPAPTQVVAEAPASVDTVECSNVERAFHAWEQTAVSAFQLDQYTAETSLDDGTGFLDEVRGYQDQPALNLAQAIAEYNYELSMHAVVLIGTNPDGVEKQALLVDEAAGKVRGAYAAFQFETCGGEGS